VAEGDQHRHAAAVAGDVNFRPRVPDQRHQSVLVHAADELLVEGGDAPVQVAAPDQDIGVGGARQQHGRRVAGSNITRFVTAGEERVRRLRGRVGDRQPGVDAIPGGAENVFGHRPGR
jgi:hypothetical protein